MEGPNAKTTTVGTGPFTFVEWVPGDHLLFNKNPNYWQTGRPYLDGVRVVITNDPQAMVAQLEGSAIDMAAESAAGATTTGSRATRSYQAVLHPNPGTYYVIGFNTLNPPFDNKSVRQACNYAFDRQRFVDTATYGAAVPVLADVAARLTRVRGVQGQLLHLRSRQSAVDAPGARVSPRSRWTAC